MHSQSVNELQAPLVQNDENKESLDDKTTARQTYFHLVKGYVGPGCLSLPWAFTQLGLIPGTLACILLACWSSYNCLVIVKLKKNINHHHNFVSRPSHQDESLLPEFQNSQANINIEQQHVHTYPDVGYWAYGKKFEVFVATAICVQQLAIGTIFLSFIGENVLAVLHQQQSISHTVVITMALPAVLGLSCLANLKQLAPVTLAGTLLLLMAFVLIGIVMVEYRHHDGSADDYHDNDDNSKPAFSSLMRLPLALCAVLYSFEGICLVLPVESAMRHPRYFPTIFCLGMGTVAALFCLVAVSCVLVFGNVNDGSITAFLLTLQNLHGRDREMILIANTLVSCSVILTYPLQLFPCLELAGECVARWRNESDHEIMVPQQVDGDRDGDKDDEEYSPRDPTSCCPSQGLCGSARVEKNDTSNMILEETDGIGLAPQPLLETRLCNHLDMDDERNVDVASRTSDDDEASDIAIPGDSPQLRLGLVLLTYLFAIVIPNVQELISLAGALAGSSTALLIPPLLELKWIQHTTNSIVAKTRCWLLFVGGLFFCVVGTGASISEIVRVYKEQKR